MIRPACYWYVFSSCESMSTPLRLSCQPFISNHSPPEWPQQSCDRRRGEEGTEIPGGCASESSRSRDSREPLQTPWPPSRQEERQEEQAGAGGDEKERQPQELHPRRWPRPVDGGWRRDVVRAGNIRVVGLWHCVDAQTARPAPSGKNWWRRSSCWVTGATRALATEEEQQENQRGGDASTSSSSSSAIQSEGGSEGGGRGRWWGRGRGRGRRVDAHTQPGATVCLVHGGGLWGGAEAAAVWGLINHLRHLLKGTRPQADRKGQSQSDRLVTETTEQTHRMWGGGWLLWQKRNLVEISELMWWRSRGGTCAWCCMRLVCAYVCVRPGSRSSSCCYLKLQPSGRHKSAVICPLLLLLGQASTSFVAADGFSDEACSFVPPTLLVHVGSHGSSQTPTLVVLWLPPVQWTTLHLRLTLNTVAVRLGKTVLVLEQTQSGDGCILSHSCYFWGLFQESLLGRSKTPTGLKLLGPWRIADRWPDKVFHHPSSSLPPLFFYKNPFSAFSKICTWWSALCFPKSYTLADLSVSVCAKIPNGVPFVGTVDL